MKVNELLMMTKQMSQLGSGDYDVYLELPDGTRVMAEKMLALSKTDSENGKLVIKANT